MTELTSVKLIDFVAEQVEIRTDGDFSELEAKMTLKVALEKENIQLIDKTMTPMDVLKTYELVDYNSDIDQEETLSKAWSNALFSSVHDGFSVAYSGSLWPIVFEILEEQKIAVVPAQDSFALDKRSHAFFMTFHEKDDFLQSDVVEQGVNSLKKIIPQALEKSQKYTL